MEKDFLNIKTAGLTAPKEYFNEMEDRVLNQIALENKTPKENPFSIPEHYFDEVEAQILEKTVVAQSKIIPLYKRKIVRYAASIAAMFVLIFTVYQIQNNPVVQSDIVSTENENDFFDIYELEEMVSNEALDTFVVENNLSDEAIYEYLSYHTDITTLVYENYEN